MQKMIYSWRWYTLGQEQYHECMSKTFTNNLSSLHLANMIIVILASCYSVFPIIVENNFRKAGIYFITALVSFFLIVIIKYKLKQIKQEKQVRDLTIYILTIIYYSNIMLFGIFLGVWSNPGNFAVNFMSFLICSLFLFNNPPPLNLCLTLGAMGVFITSSVIVKSPQHWSFDISNVSIAGSLSLLFGWQITRLRLESMLHTLKLEEERNKYFNQSTVDELTGLRNRRDFMQTFQRYLSNYRSSDDWLCIAMADIDFFKNYNDHYGHLKGDDCLRSIGKILNSLKESSSVYSARVGGEEFALLWFKKEADRADSVVSKINQLIKELNIPHAGSDVAKYVTLSIGIHIIKCGTMNDMQVLYNLADKALYMAKNDGRNCAIVCGNDITQYKITPENS